MAKIAAFGTTFGQQANTVFANIKSIKGPAIKVDMADITTHDSTGAWEESVATIIRTGEVSADIEYDPANATIKNSGNGFLSLLIGRQVDTFEITLPNASVISFDGIPSGFELTGVAADGSLQATIKIKPTGAITLP